MSVFAPAIALTKSRKPSKVHYSQYIRTENKPDPDKEEQNTTPPTPTAPTPSEPAKPETPETK